MRKPLAVGCLLSLFCQSPIFGSAAQLPIEKARYSVPSVANSYDVSADDYEYEDDATGEVAYLEYDDEIAESKGKLLVQSNPPAAKNQKPDMAQNSPMLDYRLQIGGNYTWVSIHPHGHNSFEGSLGGAQGIFEYRPMNKFYGAAKLAWKQGETHGSAGKRSLLFIDTQERLGYTFACRNDDFLLTLFSGFGYRYYGQKLNPKGGSSITFDYNEIYIPVGGMGDYAFNSWFAIGLGFTWMPQIYPTVKIVPLKGARWIITDKLANFYVEMPFTFTLTENKAISLIINPFYEYWQDGHSTAKTPSGVKLGLPGNTYNFGGVDVNFVFSF